jgi:hypothetical protein
MSQQQGTLDIFRASVSDVQSVSPTGDPAAVDRKRDQAIARVTQHAEDRRPNFVADAQAFVQRYLAQHGPTSGEQLTLACKAADITPHDDRAFGAVYQGLVRRGVIESVGTIRRERGNGTSGGHVWVLKGTR